MTNPNRVSKGVPTGGQFAATAKAEAEVALRDDQGADTEVTYFSTRSCGKAAAHEMHPWGEYPAVEWCDGKPQARPGAEVADAERGRGLLRGIDSQQAMTHAYWSMRDNGPKRAEKDLTDMIAGASAPSDLTRIERLIDALNTITQTKRDRLRTALDDRKTTLLEPR